MCRYGYVQKIHDALKIKKRCCSLPIFNYVAIDGNGQRLQGSFHTGSRDQLLRMLREKNCYPVDVQEEVISKNVDIL